MVLARQPDSKSSVVQNLAQKWKLDVTSTKAGARQLTATQSGGGIEAPPGYLGGVGAGGGAPHVVESVSRDSQQQQAHLLTKKAWDVATSPFKQLPMNMFMLYMAGGGIHIFSIMMVAMMLWRPAKAVFSVSSAFKVFDEQRDLLGGGTLTLQKLVYCLGNLVCVLVGMYKCHSMGLLPTHSSDWLDFIEPAERLQFAVASAPFASVF